MKILKFIFLISILSVITSVTYGQNVRVLTMNEAISLALSNNTDITNARLEKKKALKMVSETYNENLTPSISLSSQYNRAFKKQIFQIFGQDYEIGADNTFTHTFTLSQTIPFLGAPVFSGIRVAEYYAKLQDEIVASAESKTKTEVKKAFFNVLLLKEIIFVNELSLQNARDNYNVVEARYRNGVATEFDFLRAKVRVENVEPALSQLKNNLDISKLALKNAIGLKDAGDIDVSGKLEMDTTQVFADVNSIINKIVDNNVAIRQLGISRQMNQEAITINNANYLPKLYLFGQYQLYATEDDGKELYRYRYFNIINAGIGLSWDLNLIKNSYKVQQAEIDVKKVDEQILDIKQKLRIQTKSILVRMDDAKKRMYSQMETVKLAEKGYDIAQISYRNGVINQIDVLDAELQLNQTRVAYLQAVFDYLTAKSELEGLLEI